MRFEELGSISGIGSSGVFNGFLSLATMGWVAQWIMT